MHFGAAVEFDANGILVTVGRNFGDDDSPQIDFTKRVDGGVVVYVKASDAALRQCLFDSTTYDDELDQQDAG